MRRHYAVACTTVGMLLLLGPAAALSADRNDVILVGSRSQVDYHAEAAAARPAAGGATIIGGNIQIAEGRGTRGGLAGACDPDPRFGTHPRPPETAECAWAEPAGTGQDFISFGRTIQSDIAKESGELPSDTDTSPDGAFVPMSTPTRERFNGRGGLDKDGMRFIEERYVLDDEDLNFRIRSTGITNYLSPQGNADNRWRRLCGTGVVETFDKNAAMTAPFVAGETRAFVVQIWDADFKDPSDADGGNQDYYIVDVFKPGTSFDVGSCQPVRPPDNNPGCVVNCGGGGGGGTPVITPARTPATTPAVTPAPAAAVEAARAVAPGRARIAGARACPTRSFAVRVTGRSIRRVTFSVDGRRVATVTRPDRLGRWQVRIDPRRLRTGTHRIVAQVQFVSGAGATRTLRTSFRKCAQVAQPKFTG